MAKMSVGLPRDGKGGGEHRATQPTNLGVGMSAQLLGASPAAGEGGVPARNLLLFDRQRQATVFRVEPGRHGGLGAGRLTPKPTELDVRC